MKNITEYFEKLRLDENHHLGLGDIRLTMSQQEEIISKVRALEDLIESYRAYTSNINEALNSGDGAYRP